MTTNRKNQTTAKAADTGKSVHLSASAGSGKTRALKERYLALLDRLDRSGLNIDQAVAITFTDKAAAEIKERVMRGLPEAMLKKIIRGRQDLRISTIHSFCMNLLKRYPLEAGLPPDFGVLDARDQAHKIQKAVEDALDESDRDPGIMGPLGDFTADDLIAAVEFLLSIRSRLKRMEIDAGDPEGLLRSIRAGTGTDRAEREMNALVGSPAWKAAFMQMELLLRAQGARYEDSGGRGHASLAAAKDARAAYQAAGSLLSFYFTREAGPRKKPFITKGKYKASKTFPYTVYETLYAQVQEFLSRFRSEYLRAQAGREAMGLLALYQRAEEQYQDSKLREGLLDFDDLEIYAYRLLQNRESPDILYWLDRKILHFLVDEFQDTSDIQWAVLNKLTEEIFAGQGAEKRMPPTLFVVGDAKQSIYRFREANYRLIENVREKMEKNIPPESREILTLDRNFRSTPEVIETVNKVFTTLWGPEFQPSEVERKTHRGGVRLIELQPGKSEEKPGGRSEAEVLAGEIRNLVDGGTIIYEKSPGSRWDLPRQNSSRGGNDVGGWLERAARYDDCAVLIQSRTRLKEYEAALQKERVPFRVVGGIGFYEEDEIQAVLNALFFLWNKDDKLALAAALKSALFGLTDRDIFELIRDGGDMVDSLRRDHSPAGALLDNWKRYASTEPLAGLIHRIIQDTGAYVRFGGRNPQAIFNLDKLLDTAREFDRRGYTTLQDFVQWVKNIREAEQREATADMNLPGFQGAVSIMTVHKAKGLEFPVVFLPGMNQFPKSATVGPRAIIDADGGRVRMAVKNAANPVYDEMWEQEQEEVRREHQRLLYVAMTRARDHLVMLGTLGTGDKPVKQNTWLSCLHQAIPAYQKEGAEGPVLVAYSYPEWKARVVPIERPASKQEDRKEQKQGVAVDGKAVFHNLSPVAPSEPVEWKKATDFIDHDRDESLARLVAEAGAVSPLARGSVLHRCLEKLTKDGVYNLEQIVKEFPEIETLDPETMKAFYKDAEAVLKAVVGNRDFAWIFEQTPGAYSELPFLYRRGRDIISGVMDRVVIREGRGFVIDYKAILVESDGALQAWQDHYRPQIRVYCEAVKEIFKLDRVEGYLLYLDSGRLELTITL